MQFYKTRTFGELIADTFTFIRKYGKNYFKNFILLNGGILLLLLLVIILGYGELIQQLFSSNLGGQQFYFEEYFSQNQGVFIGVTLLILCLGTLLTMITYSYPVLYMKRLANDPNSPITNDVLLQDFKGIWVRFIKFYIGTLIIIVPIATIILLVSFALIFLIIGILIMMIVVPLIMNIVNLTLFDYYHTKNHFLTSLKFAILTQFSNQFFKYIGSMIIMYFVVSTVTSIFSIIPAVLIMSGDLLVPASNSSDSENLVLIITATFYMLYMVITLIVSNVYYINAGLMYYDAKTEFHHDIQIKEIESLGNQV